MAQFRHFVLFLVFSLTLLALIAEAEHDKGRDPFKFGAANMLQELKQGYDRQEALLEMVLISGDLKIAVFNGRGYREGDVIDGYKITSILIDKVNAHRNGEEIIFIIDVQ